MSAHPHRVALVTGGSRGIGRGIALALARIGCDLVLNYRANEAAARGAKAEVEALGRRAEIVQGDVAVREDREAMLEAVRKHFDRLDVLVNNAGMVPDVRRDILEAQEEDYDRVMAVNLKGPYFLTQQAARWMADERRAHPDRDCVIVYTGSMSSYTVSLNRGEYCLSKAGITMATRLWAVRLAEFGIRVHEIRPGIIATDLTRGVKEKYDRLIGEGIQPIRRWGTPEDIGRAVAAIAAGAFPFSTGTSFDVDGGYHIHVL
ncbi:MAG: 3-ketoacyl-ACP reductase [Candidatus Rokubacteria bacterium]|nr:3-ketoacyl-ACP reductase [Candidatus Rokubacteria bacterium]